MKQYHYRYIYGMPHHSFTQTILKSPQSHSSAEKQSIHYARKEMQCGKQFSI